MKAKAIACVFLAAALASAPVFAESGSAEAIEVTQNPIMNYAGTYGAGRAGIRIEAEGADEGKVEVIWGSSAAEHSEWKMSGPFDPETGTLSYSNCVRKNIELDEEGGEVSVETVYENGTGTMVFSGGEEISLVWNDDMESAAEDIVFEFDGPGVYDDSVSMREGAESIPDIEAMAENSEFAVVSTSDIEEGVMTVRLENIGTAKEGFRWEFLGDGSVDDDDMVELVSESDEEGSGYVGSFRALQDGETYIRLIHTNGTYSDMYMDFNVKAENGEITENTGGSCAYGVVPAEFLDAFLEGEWREEDSEALSMTFSLAEDGEIQAAISDETGEILNTEVYYDAMYEIMVYDGGALIPDMRSESPEDAGILWRNDNEESSVVHRFVKTAGGTEATSEAAGEAASGA